MNAALRRHYDAIRALGLEDWPTEDVPEGDCTDAGSADFGSPRDASE